MGAGDATVLNSHTEVMIYDLAAALLDQLEDMMLTCTPAAVDLSTALDNSPDFQPAPGAASALEAVSNRLYSDEVPSHRCGGNLPSLHVCRLRNSFLN